MRIYDSTENDFTKNGEGLLTDLLEASVTESLNGDMFLEFTYPINGHNAEKIQEEKIIKCPVGNGNSQLFRIKRIVKDYTEMTIYAPHIFYDLLDNFVLDTAPANLTCQSFGQWVLSKTNYATNFTFESDISTSASARYVRRNPVDIIIGDTDNSMVNLFRGELERDNFKIKLLEQRGSADGIVLIFGKNIKQIKITRDDSSIYTRILPIGFDGLTLPETYVDSPLINDYRAPRITKAEFNEIKLDPEDENAYHTEDEAYQALREATNKLFISGIDKPRINIKIDWLELSKTEEYKNYQALETIHLGDTITAKILGIDYQTRVTKTEYDVLTDSITKFEIGTISRTIANAINSNTKAVESISIPSILTTAKNNATEQITSAMGGYVYKTQTELYIMDAPTPEQAQKVWRWNINGLGYSSTGINGPYGIAMTQDGQIVADFITTGTMSAERITGLKDIILDEYGAYIHINDDGSMEVGRQDYDYRLVINNAGITIYNGTTPISYWQQEQFTARQINLGNFSFIPRENGSLSFRKTGGN